MEHEKIHVSYIPIVRALMALATICKADLAVASNATCNACMPRLSICTCLQLWSIIEWLSIIDGVSRSSKMVSVFRKGCQPWCRERKAAPLFWKRNNTSEVSQVWEITHRCFVYCDTGAESTLYLLISSPTYRWTLAPLFWRSLQHITESWTPSRSNMAPQVSSIAGLGHRWCLSWNHNHLLPYSGLILSSPALSLQSFVALALSPDLCAATDIAQHDIGTKCIWLLLQTSGRCLRWGSLIEICHDL